MLHPPLAKRENARLTYRIASRLSRSCAHVSNKTSETLACPLGASYVAKSAEFFCPDHLPSEPIHFTIHGECI